MAAVPVMALVIEAIQHTVSSVMGPAPAAASADRSPAAAAASTPSAVTTWATAPNVAGTNSLVENRLHIPLQHHGVWLAQVVACYASFFGFGLLAYGLAVWPQKRPGRASLASKNHNRGLILGGTASVRHPYPAERCQRTPVDR